MAKTSGEIEREFLDGLKSSTGNDLNAWLSIIKKSGIEKRNDIIDWLKKDQGFGHMNASLLAGIYFNNGKPVYGSEENLLENQFAKCEEMRSLFGKVSSEILKQFPGAQMIPKKTYVSFTAKREFAAINIKPKELRLGLDLGDMPFNEIIQKTKLTGPMPRISHMVVLTGEGQLNKTLSDYLSQSFQRVNK
jgi:predicted transport protein